MQLVIILFIILAILLVIFTLQNTLSITLHFLLWEITDAPLVLVLLACLFTGYLMALFYFLPKTWKLKREIKKLQKRLPAEEEKPIDSEENHPEGMLLEPPENTDSRFFD